MADDGSFPMRAIVQMRGRRDKQFWKRGRVQAQYLPRGLWIEAVHFYAVRPEYCHEHHLWESIANVRGTEHGDPDSETGGLHPKYTPFIQGLDIINNRKFKATSPMAVIRYCFENNEENTRVQYRVPQKQERRDESVLDHSSYLKKPKMMTMITHSHYIDYKPRFRVGVLHDQTAKNLKDITGWEKWSLTNGVGNIAFDVSWVSGADTVKKYEEEKFLSRHGSVSEAILMNLKREPPVLRPPGATGEPMEAIEDQQFEAKAVSKSAARRQRKKVQAGGAGELKATTGGPKKFAGYLRYAHQAIVKLPADYYGSSNGMGMWRLPEFENLTDDRTESEDQQGKRQRCQQGVHSGDQEARSPVGNAGGEHRSN